MLCSYPGPSHRGCWWCDTAEVAAPIEGRVSQSCSALAGACRLQARGWPCRDFCGSWLQGSWRDLLVLGMPLTGDKINCVTWVQSSSCSLWPYPGAHSCYWHMGAHRAAPMVQLSVPSNSPTTGSVRNWLQLFWWTFCWEDFILSSCYSEPDSRTCLDCSVWLDWLRWLSKDMALPECGHGTVAVYSCSLTVCRLCCAVLLARYPRLLLMILVDSFFGFDLFTTAFICHISGFEGFFFFLNFAFFRTSSFTSADVKLFCNRIYCQPFP